MDQPVGGELTNEIFTRRLVTTLAAEVEAVVGREALDEIVALVGLEMATTMESAVAAGIVNDPASWTRDELGRVLVALKQRIDGGFFVESIDETGTIVLGNTRCPFGAAVEGRPALCNMTSSVFGGIAARHFGSAAIEIQESIARGHDRCRVIIRPGDTLGPTGRWIRHYHGEK